MATTSGPTVTDFAKAAAYGDATKQIVTSNLVIQQDRAKEMYEIAKTTIEEIGTVPPLEDFFLDPGNLGNSWLGYANAFKGDKPVLDALLTAEPVVIGDAPTATIDDIFPGTAPVYVDPGIVINLPPQPPPLDLTGEPDKPPIDLTVDFPDDPDTTEPPAPFLDSIILPGIPAVLLPGFDGQYPGEFTDAPPSATVSWSEPTYVPDILPAIRPVIIDMLDGAGLPPAVEQALFDKAAVREDQTALKLTNEAFNTWAANGFTMPPGMLVEQVNAAQQANALSRNSLSRDILIKQWDLHYENLKFAVVQGLAYEGVLVAIFNNMAQRTFEMAKLQLESQIHLYDSAITAYNARISAYSAAAQVQKNKLEAELAKVQIYKTEMEGQKIVSDINQQRVNTYATQMQVLKTRVDIYTAVVNAELARLEVAKIQIDVYKAEIEAWATNISAQKTSFDAYNSAVQGESSKASMMNALAQAFSSQVNAYAAGENVKVSRVEAQIKEFGARIDGYKASIEGKTAQLDLVIKNNQSLIDKFQAEVTMYKVDADSYDQLVDANTKISEANLRQIIETYNANLNRYRAKAEAYQHLASINTQAMQSAAQTASSVAQGAMSAVHIGQTIGSTATTDASYNESLYRTTTA